MKERNAGFDYIRILLTALVVLHHTAIAYGGAGGWYWRAEPDGSNTGLVTFNAINQSFFMGFFFLLAGYFSANSLARKGSLQFLKDRFIRLGLPLLAFFVLLSPLTGAIANAESITDIWPVMVWQYQNMELGVGPLWFAEALLIFSTLLVIFNKVLQKTTLKASQASEGKARSFPPFFKLLIIALLLGGLTFALRLFIKVGEEVLWLQLAYFPCYVFLFYAGVTAWQGRVLETLSSRQMFPWAIVLGVCIVVLPFGFMGSISDGDFSGGMNLNALFYAMWNPLMGFGVIIFMLWFFQAFCSNPTVLSAFLARRAFVVFIIHPPVVVGFSLLVEGVELSSKAKFLMVGGLSLVGCVFVGSILLVVPAVKKII